MEKITNEEKAKELAQLMFPNNMCIWARGNVEAEKVEYATLTMAKWKDEQHKQELIRIYNFIRPYLDTKELSDNDLKQIIGIC